MQGLNIWFDYLKTGNDAYTNSMKLIIADGITKDLKSNNDKLPPKFDAGVLADTMVQIQNKVKDGKINNINFLNMYQNLIKAEETGIVSSNKEVEKGDTRWVVIPSKENDPENFDKNVERLQTLSCKSWCTKSYNARPYLSQGDFHVYLENGKPKIGLRFIGDKIQEIQGEKNNSKIPIKYLYVVKSHIEGQELTPNATNEIKNAEELQIKLNNIQLDAGKPLRECPSKELFRAFGMLEKVDDDGLLIIKEYKQPDKDFSWDDIGIDENKLVKDVKEIKGNADFHCSKVSDLRQLQKIGGNANFKYSKVSDLGQLQEIGGDCDFLFSEVTNLDNLKRIGGNAMFHCRKIKDLGNLQYIGGNAKFHDSYIENLSKLQIIGGNAYFNRSPINNLESLQKIGGNADFSGTKITNINKLQTIGGDAYLGFSELSNLPNLQSIGGNARFDYSKSINLENLREIGKNAAFDHSKITDINTLQTIGGEAYFNDSQVKNFKNFKKIQGNVHIMRSKLTPQDFNDIEVRGKIFI